MVLWLGLDIATSGGAISDAARWAEQIMEEIGLAFACKSRSLPIATIM